MSYSVKMSEIQKSIYYDCCTGHHLDYNISVSLEIIDCLDIEKLEYAVNLAASEQEALSMSVKSEAELTMVVNDDVYVEIGTISSNTEVETEKTVSEIYSTPFDLFKAPLLSVNYIKAEESPDILVLSMHHIVADGISLDLFVKRVFSLYDGLVKNKSPKVNFKSNKAFSRFIERENSKLNNDEYSLEKEYWKNLTKEISSPEIIRNLSEYNQTSKKTNNCGEINILLEEKLYSSSQDCARKLDVSEYMFHLAIFMTTLSLITDKDRFGVSSPFTFRETEEDQQAVGCYIYYYPLVYNFENNTSFSDVASKVRDQIWESYLNIGYPNNLIARDWDNTLSDDTIFDYSFIYDDYDDFESEYISNVKTWPFSRFPGKLSVILQRIGNQVSYKIQYKNNLYSEEFISLLGKRLIRVLEAVCVKPDIKVGDIDIFLPDEHVLLDKYENETYYFDFKDECIADLFEARVREHEEQTAIITDNRTYSYKEINNMSNHVAQVILEIGNDSVSKVAALYMDRSVEMVITIIGILKAGWTYVPMDFSYTKDKILYIEQDATVDLFFTTDSQLEILSEITKKILISVQEVLKDSSEIGNPNIKRNSKELAYIEYTSGSTGEPKGVMIENASIVNTVKDLERRFPLQEDDVYMLKTSVTFDIFGTELYGWIVGKGSLYILNAGLEMDVFAILNAIKNYEISHINFVPSMLQIFLDSLNDEASIEKVQSLKWIFTGGEEIKHNLVKRYLDLNLHASLENVYGPTEATMWASNYKIDHVNNTLNVPIGKALNKYRLYVVNKSMKRLPIMVPGELCISGPGLARGYLNKSELMQETFVNNPFYDKEEEEYYQRLYKTGDLVRMLPDGNYEFLGRKDTQIKINGIRIELGEIEAVLSKYPGISNVVAMLDDTIESNVNVALFYNSVSGEIEEDELAKFAEAHLNPTLVPSKYIFIDKIPRTLSEKIDRNELRKLLYNAHKTTKNESIPTNSLEKQILVVWKEILGMDSIGVDDNFFRIGGHSIALIKVHQLLCQKLNRTFPITVLLNNPTIKGMAKVLGVEVGKNKEVISIEQKSSGSGIIHDDIAIVGMAINVPGADTLHEFWDNLVAEKDCIYTYTTEELKALGIDDKLIQNPNYVRRKGRINGIDCFDNTFFQLSPGEVNMMSPQLRVLYKGVFQAMEDAGVSDGRYNDRTGVYMGASDDFIWYQNKLLRNGRFSDTYQIYTQSTNHFIATRISHMFDLKGPSMSILTGCSTSLVTVHTAAKALQNKECDLAIAGGVTVELPNEGGYLYEPNLMFSKDGKCKPFDDKADGTIFSNGMGVVVLKRLSEAREDNDHIYAVIKGSAVRNDGKEKLSYTAPSATGQALAMKAAYEDAKISTSSIGYIEAHGTGTKLGDPIEIDSLSSVFGKEKQENPCIIGSVKGNIGHTDTASGVVGLIKTALCLDNKYIPGTINYETPNQNIDFEHTNFEVHKHGSPWVINKCDSPRRAAINSFGVGGSNVHMILEEDLSTREKQNGEINDKSLLVLSGTSRSSLSNNMAKLAQYVKQLNSMDRDNMSWSLLNGRKDFDNRGFFIVDNDEIVEQFSQKEFCFRENNKICFLFTGQGSQYQGMGKDLFKDRDSKVCKIYRKHVKEILGILSEEEKNTLERLLYGSDNSEQINQTQHSQLALFVTEYAMASTLVEFGIKPDILIGHSVGEVTAAAFAGVWRLDDAVQIVKKRATLMQAQEEGAMLSVAISREKAEDYISQVKGVWLSLNNTTNRCVIGGEPDCIKQLQKTFRKEGIDSAILRTSHAFHTPMMREASKAFKDFLHNVKMFEPCYPIIANLNGEYVKKDQLTSPEYWGMQIINPVEFEDALSNILNEENVIFFELAGRTLCSFVNNHYKKKPSHLCVSCLRHPKEKKNDVEVFLGALGKAWCAGVSVDFRRLFEENNNRRVYIPPYCFEEMKFPIEGNCHTAKQAVLNDIVDKTNYLEKNSFLTEREKLSDVVVTSFREIFELDNINSQSDFFKVGGDSMHAASLAAILEKETGQQVTVSEIFSNTTPEKLTELLMSKGQSSDINEQVYKISPVKPRKYYPATPAQQRIYTLYMMDNKNLAYNLPSATMIDGKLNIDKVNEALQKLIGRHDILRTSFEIVDNKVVQKINHSCQLKVDVEVATEQLDLSKIASDFIKPFSLKKAPLMRVKIIQYEEKTLLLFDVHHIIADGTAVELLTRDFNEIYTDNQSLRPLNIQYKDYAVWLESYSKSDAIKHQKQYWLDNLSGKLPTLTLESDYERPNVKSVEGKRINFDISKSLFDAVKLRAKDLGVTNNILMMSAWNLVLAKYSDASELIIGTSVSGRTNEATKDCIGMFVNMLAIRTFPQKNKKLYDYIQEVKYCVSKALENQDFQFDTLIDSLNISRQLNRNPLFDVCFDYHNIKQFDLSLEGLSLKQEELDTGKIDYDLVLTCAEHNNQSISIFIDYCTAMFSEETIRAYADTLIAILEQISVVDIEDIKNCCIEDLHLTSERELATIDSFNTSTRKSWDYNHSIISLLEKQVSLKKTETAIINSGGKEFSYEEIYEKIENLSLKLLKAGAVRGTRICIVPERNENMVIALWAVMRIGATYIPIDISYPKDRILEICSQSKTTIILGETHRESLFDGKYQFIAIDKEEIMEGDDNIQLPSVTELGADPNELAYILFTSGSTGKPKGVKVTRKNLLNFIYDTIERGLIGKTDDRVCSLTSPAFDIFGYEAIATLCSGSSLYICSSLEQLDAKKVGEKIVKYQLNHILGSVSRLRAFAENKEFTLALTNLKYILAGGETFPISFLNFLKAHTNAKIFNLYGPTETTIWSTVKELTNEDTVSIGKAIANTSLYITNKNGNILPRGAWGELCIAGDGVAEGYIENEEGTLKHFVPNNELQDLVVYKTGDRCRMLSDGEIELSGRFDHQVKVHGCRVELSEIEKVVLQYPDVSHAVALVDKNDVNDQLVLFYTGTKDSEKRIKNYIAKTLPTYMIVDKIIFLDEMPLNINGKTDRLALQHKLSSKDNVQYVQENQAGQLSRNVTSSDILDIWSNILHDHTLTKDDNFFEVGGNSYSLMLVANKMSDLLGETIEVTLLFEYPTVNSISHYLNLDSDTEVKITDVVSKVSENHSRDEMSLTQQEEFSQSDQIAIVGLSGTFPGAGSVREFWNNILQGQESIKNLTEEELLAAGISQTDIVNPNYVKAKGCLDSIDSFDYEFFGMTKRDAELMDPQIRLLMQCCYNALEDANCVVDNYDGDIALFAGSSSNLMWMSKFLSQEDIVNQFNTMTLNDKDFLTSQISYRLNLTGPSINIQTACSTSLVAICQAAQCILDGEVEMALAGGVSISYPRNEGYLWHENMIYSKDGHCRAFSDDASGTVSGEGCGVVVLKRLSCAIADGDAIYAVIDGFALNNDGFRKVGYTAPSIAGQKKVIRKALDKSSATPASIGYVEAHGTGTKLGDPIEVESLRQAWDTGQNGYCALGSVKSNVGHLDAAAGVASFIKAVNVLYHQVIPPQININKINPLLHLDSSPFYVSSKTMTLPDNFSHAAVSSFGIGGTNAHVILRKKQKEDRMDINDDFGLFLISAKSEDSLLSTSKAICNNINDNVIADVSHTLAVGRKEYPFRKAFVVTSNSPEYDIDQNEEVFYVDESIPKLAGICFTNTSDYTICDFARNLMVARARHQIIRDIRKIMSDFIETEDERITRTTERVIYSETTINEGDFSPEELQIASKAVKEVLSRLTVHYSQVENDNFVVKSDTSQEQNLIKESLLLFDRPIESQKFLMNLFGKLWMHGYPLNLEKMNPGRKCHVHGYVFKKNLLDSDVNLSKVFLPNNSVSATHGTDCVGDDNVSEIFQEIWEEILGGTEVSDDRDFFDEGGDSLGVIRLTSLIEKKFGFSLSQNAIFEARTFGEIVKLIEKNNTLSPVKGNTLVKSLDNQIYEVASSAQKRQYTLQSIHKDSTAYNLAAGYTIDGTIDKVRIRNAVQQLANRHDSFRTSFHLEGGDIVQQISDTINAPITFETQKDTTIQRCLDEFVKPFDLSKAPLVQMKLVSVSESKHYLLIDMHHIIADQSSLDILMKDFYKFYKGETVDALPVHYKDFAKLQKDKIESGEVKKQLTYWMNQINEDAIQTSLQPDYLPTVKRTYTGKKVRFNIDIGSQLSQFANKHQVTPYMVLFTTLSLLLWKYIGKNNFIIGTGTEGREKPELFNIMGMFVNTLPVCVNIDDKRSIEEQLQYTKKIILNALENQDCQYEEIVDKVRNELGITAPLINILINYVTKGTQELEIDGLTLTPYESDDITAKFDLMFVIEKNEVEQYDFQIEYATELFSLETITQLGNRFITLLDIIINNPKLKLEQFSIPVSNQEIEVYSKVSDVRRNESKRSIWEYFKESALKNKDKVAIKEGSVQLTYGQLLEKVEILYTHLIGSGVNRGSRVSLILDSGIEQIVSILAVLKSGASYVPIDPTFPQERIRYILKDSHSVGIITNTVYEHLYLEEMDKIWNIDNVKEKVNLYVDVEESSINDEAYVIYTSGTTGKPKGVSVKAKSILRIAYDMNFMSISAGDCILKLANYSFDASIFEIFVAILNGGYCLCVSKENLLELDALNKLISSEKIHAAFFTTAFFNLIVDFNVDILKGIDFILTGGEAHSVRHMKKALDAVGPNHLINVYGPTETTVFATYYPVNEVSENTLSIPIGYAITDTQLYILDDSGRLLPPGIPGELCIGGTGVSNGYINDSERTKQYFRTHSFDSFVEEERIYHSGDRVIMRGTGELIYLGRMDSQVKINGFRIELGEIERYFENIEGVKESAVIVRIDDREAKSLTAFYTVSEGNYDYITSDYITRYLRKTAPDYMIPSEIIKIDEMPLNVSKKIDKKKLSLLNNKTSFMVAKSEIEDKDKGLTYILNLFKEVLNSENVQEEDNFFLLGGTSIKAIVLEQKLKDSGFNISVNEIINHPTPKELYNLHRHENYIEDGDNSKEPSLKQVTESELYGISEYIYYSLAIIGKVVGNMEDRTVFPMTPIQTLQKDVSHRASGLSFNIHTNKGEADIKCALAEVILRHQLLHSKINLHEEQLIEKDVTISKEELSQYITYKDMSTYNRYSTKRFEDIIYERLLSEDFSKADMPWKLCLVKEDDENYMVLWGIDHIIFDGMSSNIIKNELLLLINGQVDKLPRVQKYSDYGKDMSDSTLFKGPSNLSSWLQQNKECMTIFNQNSGDIKSIELTLPINNKSDNLVIYTLQNVISLLSNYISKEEIPLMLVEYGRYINGHDYHNCVGEFLDLIPLLLNQSINYDNFEKLLECYRGKNSISQVIKANNRQEFIYKGIGQFIICNYQGYVSRRDRNIYKKANTEQNGHDLIAEITITAGYSDDSIFVQIESKKGFDEKKLMRAMSKTKLRVNKESKDYI